MYPPCGLWGAMPSHCTTRQMRQRLPRPSRPGHQLPSSKPLPGCLLCLAACTSTPPLPPLLTIDGDRSLDAHSNVLPPGPNKADPTRQKATQSPDQGENTQTWPQKPLPYVWHAPASPSPPARTAPATSGTHLLPHRRLHALHQLLQVGVAARGQVSRASYVARCLQLQRGGPGLLCAVTAMRGAEDSESACWHRGVGSLKVRTRWTHACARAHTHTHTHTRHAQTTHIKTHKPRANNMHAHTRTHAHARTHARTHTCGCTGGLLSAPAAGAVAALGLASMLTRSVAPLTGRHLTSSRAWGGEPAREGRGKHCKGSAQAGDPPGGAVGCSTHSLHPRAPPPCLPGHVCTQQSKMMANVGDLGETQGGSPDSDHSARPPTRRLARCIHGVQEAEAAPKLVAASVPALQRRLLRAAGGCRWACKGLCLSGGRCATAMELIRISAPRPQAPICRVADCSTWGLCSRADRHQPEAVGD